jgi:hypothetical protein
MNGRSNPLHELTPLQRFAVQIAPVASLPATVVLASMGRNSAPIARRLLSLLYSLPTMRTPLSRRRWKSPLKKQPDAGCRGLFTTDVATVGRVGAAASAVAGASGRERSETLLASRTSMTAKVYFTALMCLCLGSIPSAQTEGVFERLQRYQERYNQWASRHTFVWEIEYSDTRNKAILAGELPNREDIRRAIEQSPEAVFTRVRLTIARTPELCMVMQEHISGEWPYEFKTKRTYLGKDWEASETEIIYRDRRGVKVTVMPVRERKDFVIYDDILVLPFVSLIYGAVFFAGTNPFTHLETRCSQPPAWQLERITSSRVWLKSSLGSGDEDRLAINPEGWVIELQRRIGSSFSRDVVLETIKRDGFVVPSKLAGEYQSHGVKGRLLARLVALKETEPLKIEYPLNAEVSDYRLMTPEEMCADHKTELKGVDYLWKGNLPTLAELEQMRRAQNPDPLRVPPPRQGARWLLYLPGILLIAIGVYLWWRNRR